MALARPITLALVALAACAGPGGAGRPGDAAEQQARLAARAARWVGHEGSFSVGETRFRADCSGFVEAVYAAEGLPLRRLAALAAPGERSGVAALHRAAARYGVVFGGGGEWPAPGDLVFFHDTYDRDRDGGADDRFTHVGIVESVAAGTVVFLHRGGAAVVRAVLTPERPLVAREGKRVVNSPLREKRRGADVPVLAGALFAGYARMDAASAARAR